MLMDLLGGKKEQNRLCFFLYSVNNSVSLKTKKNKNPRKLFRAQKILSRRDVERKQGLTVT